MRRYLGYIFFCFIVALAFTSCEKDFVGGETELPTNPETGIGNVLMALSDDGTRANFEGVTRAMIAQDGKNLQWQAGDRFRLYAYKSDGSNAFTGNNKYIDFRYWVNSITPGRTLFQGSLDADMTSGSYNYYAVYPHTTPVEGTTATFYLPSAQDGTYNEALDFMVARTTSNALERILDEDPNTPEPLNDIGLTFKHQLHALRFEIPSEGILINGIRRVHILFPEAVAGEITVDMSSEVFATTYANTSNKITVDFGAGNEKQSGDTFWVMILPQVSYSRAVDIRFEDSDGNYTERKLVTFPTTQQYTAGRVTPIKMSVPSKKVGYTYLDATTIDTQLGEPVQKLHLDLPEGYYFTDYSNVLAVGEDNNGVHTFTLFSDLVDTTLRNSNLTLTYDSEHALIPTTTSFGSGLRVGQRNKYELTTPYLFYEDFSNVVSNEDEYTNTDGAMMDKGGLVGWSGSRWKTDGGNKLLNLSCYVGTTAGNTNIQYGRADTPPLTNIKAGKNPNIRVVYDLGLEENWSVTAEGSWAEVTWWRIQAQLCYGTTEYDANNPVTTGGNLAILGSLGKGQGRPQTELGVINTNVLLMDNDDGYVANRMNKNVSFTTSATNTTRITWFEDYYHTSGVVTDMTLDLYLDNVRVSISQ